MNPENRLARLERLLLELVRTLNGHTGGVDDKGNAVNYQNEVLARIEKELAGAAPSTEPGK